MGNSYSLGADKGALIFFVYMAINRTIVHTTFILLGCFLFVCALYIYISNRNDDMILYDWFGIDYNNYFFEYMRHPDLRLSSWAIYNLPDGLWMMSFLLFIEVIWDGEKLMKWIFGGSMIILALVLEIFQFVDLFPGTGDWLDILFYIAAVLLFLLLIKLKQIYYEKNI